MFSGRQPNSDCDGSLRPLNLVKLAIQPTEYESYGKSSLHSFSCRILLAVSVDDAAALRSQLWRFRRAVALLDQAGDYPQGMLECGQTAIRSAKVGEPVIIQLPHSLRHHGPLLRAAYQKAPSISCAFSRASPGWL